MIEITWVAIICLLIIAVFSGWLYGRYSYRNSSPLPQQRTLISLEYLKGLNYVLNEQTDKAVDIFLRILEVDRDTIETHFALGNLFRHQGEIGRAIRVHENLLKWRDISSEHRSQAMFELGMDYMKSGLFDRAEKIFTDLLDSGFYLAPALTELLDIFQREKDWDNAIKIATQLDPHSSYPLNGVIAQFYCEQANELHANGQDREARKLLKKALNTDINCVRASFAEADFLRKEGKYSEAIRFYKNIERQDPDYICEVIPLLFECYQEIGKLDEFKEYLNTIVNSYSDITSILMLAHIIERQDGSEKAMEFITDKLSNRQSMHGFSEFIKYALAIADNKLRNHLMVMQNVLNRSLREQSIYQCNRCGFSGRLLCWQCPRCKQWNTMKPCRS